MSKDFNCYFCELPMQKAVNKEAWVCQTCEIAILMMPAKKMEHVFPKVLEDQEIIGPLAIKFACLYCREIYRATSLRGGVCQACIWKRKGEQNG